MRAGFATKKAAEQALAEFLVQAGRGAVPAPGRQSVEQYLDGWLTGMELSLAATAFTGYRAVLRLYVLPRIGTVQLAKVTAASLTALYGELLAGGGKAGRCPRRRSAPCTGS